MYIDEESYQQIKEKMCKTDDYFTEQDIKTWCNSSAITTKNNEITCSYM